MQRGSLRRGFPRPLTAYMVRCPFSLDRIISVSNDGKLVYRAGKADCQPFPIHGNEKRPRGAFRNSEAFEPLGSLAETTQHIPGALPASCGSLPSRIARLPRPPPRATRRSGRAAWTEGLRGGVGETGSEFAQ